ncbi:DUF3987 domain-containing protein [Rheinheimera pacifica]|nr:DUF3987 domain-containing protein [Rheinheimera pacifica]
MSEAYDAELSDVLKRNPDAAFCSRYFSKVKICFMVHGTNEDFSELKKHVAALPDSKSYSITRSIPVSAGMVHFESLPTVISHYKMASLLNIDIWLPFKKFEPRSNAIKQFQKDMSPNWFYEAVMGCAADNKPIDYCWAGLVCLIGAMLAKKVKVTVDEGEKGLAPNLWANFVGEPGSGKTPVIDMLTRLAEPFTVDPKSSSDMASRSMIDSAISATKVSEVKKIIKNATENDKSINIDRVIKQVSRKFKVEETKIAEYIGKLVITTDTTAAGLNDLLEIDELSVMLLADELKTLLQVLSSKDNAKLRGQLLQAESSNSLMMVARANQASKTSHNATISVLAGIQPDALAPFLNAAMNGDSSNDGFLNRFLLTVKNVTEFTDSYTASEKFDKKAIKKFIRAVYRESFDFIDRIDGQYGLVGFSEEAKKLFKKWKTYNTEQIKNAPNSYLANQFSKYVGLVPRLSLIYQVMNKFSSSKKKIEEFQCIDLAALSFAIKSVEYLRSHAISIFSADENILHVESTAVLKRLIDTGYDKFTVSELSQRDWRFIKRDTDKALKVLQYLESFGLVRANTVGRRIEWEVNPLVQFCFN